MALSSSRIKDSRGSWLFLAMAGSIMGCAGGLLDSIGILVVIFVEYFDETNTKIGIYVTWDSIHFFFPNEND